MHRKTANVVLENLIDKLKEEIIDYIGSTAHQALVIDAKNLMRVEDLESEILTKMKRKNMSDDDKERILNQIR